jgi:hypothetical protein
MGNSQKIRIARISGDGIEGRELFLAYLFLDDDGFAFIHFLAFFSVERLDEFASIVGSCCLR